MRLTGFVNVAGSRERIDWTITSSGIISGAGLSADEVNLSIPLPETIPQTDEVNKYWGSKAKHINENPGRFWRPMPWPMAVLERRSSRQLDDL